MSNSGPHHISHRWTVDDISNKLFNTRVYSSFTSPAFTLPSSTSTSSPSQFELKLYPKGVNDNFKYFLSIGLSSFSFGGQLKCLLRCQFSLIDSEGQKKNTKELYCYFSSDKFCSVLGEFITKSNLINPKNSFVRNDKLTLDCQITILGEPSSVAFFDSFVNDLKYISKSNTNLMKEMYHDLAFQHKVNEFPDSVPLIDLQFDVPIEETLTHHACFGFDSPILSKNKSIYKAITSRYFGFPELSRQQTLLNLKSILCGNNNQHCDFTFLVEGKQFRSTKSILAVQSPVFEAMFSHNMKEKSEVCLSDLTAEGFQQFLHYLCTGKVSSSMFKSMELLETANKYIIHSIDLLRHQCETILCNQAITVETAFELLQFSERFSLSRLKQICYPYAIDHCGKFVANNSFSSKIEPTLLQELFRDLAQKHRHNEFPNRVPLDLISSLDLVPLEDTMTHYAKYSLSSKIYLPNRGPGQSTWSVCASENPDIKFSINLNWIPRPNMFGNSCRLSISYLSAPYIFADVTITRNKFLGFWTTRQWNLTELLNSFDRVEYDFEILVAHKDVTLTMNIWHKKACRKSGYPEIKSQVSRAQLLMDLKSALNGGKHCDVVLLVEDKHFCAHKAILAAQSIVFEVMFSHDMKEKFESQVSITDVTAQAFEHFLNYLYSRKLFTKVNWQIMELFEIADKYIVELLKAQCENILCLQIVTKDAIEILQFSERYSLGRLKQICFNFIFDHCFDVLADDSSKIATKIEPLLLMEMFGELAHKYQHNEFPNYVPLNLPCGFIPEEALTHRPKANLIFESTRWKFGQESFRKLDSSELKSLSREQTLLGLKTMLEGGKHCDVTLLVESKQFRSHKSILVARSIVFEAMFRYDWKENVENQVEIHDVDVEVFEQFMLYLYTGKVDCPIMGKHAMDLFVLADMHNLSTLQETCLRVFGQSLTPESVAEQFELADRLGLIEFKQVCTDYMNKTN